MLRNVNAKQMILMKCQVSSLKNYKKKKKKKKKKRMSSAANLLGAFRVDVLPNSKEIYLTKIARKSLLRDD